MRLRLPPPNLLVSLALIAISLPATIPFWQPDFILTADSPLHLWRIYELDRALSSGTFYPRWAPDLYFGYGYPVFNFYPPLGYYLTELLHFFGLGLADGLKAVFSFGILLAALGGYLLARDLYRASFKHTWQADAAGLVSAAAFAYSPYLLVDIYVRGAVAEVLGMALLPLYLWSLRRLLIDPAPPAALLSGIIGALFLLAHNLTAFIAAPVLALFVLLHLLSSHGARPQVRALLSLAGSALLTLALSAFYWLPAVIELPLVYIGRPELTRSLLRQTVLDHVQPVQHLIQLRWIYDYLQGSFPLGLMSVVLAVSGLLVGLWFLRGLRRLELAYLALVALIAGLAQTEWARSVWLALPALWFIQFIWRLEVLYALGAAVAAGACVLLAVRLFRRPLAVAAASFALIVLLGAASLLNLHAQPWFTDVPPGSNPEVLARYEVDFRETGMSSMNEYLPATVQRVPIPPVKLNAAAPVAAAAPTPFVELLAVGSNRWELRVRAGQATSLTFRTFYYPDWYGSIDGAPAAVHPSTSAGLLTVDVPAGEHAVRLDHASLPARDAGMLLTSTAVLALFIALGYLAFRGQAGWKLPGAILGSALVVFALPHARGLMTVAPAFNPVSVQVDSGLQLVGYSLEQQPSQLKLHLYWFVETPPAENVPTHVQLVDANGKVWASRSSLPSNGADAVRFWVPNEIVNDDYDVFLPSGSPPGTLSLEVSRGQEPFVHLAQANLIGGAKTETPQEIDMRVDARLGDVISLVGFNAPAPTTHQGGDSVPLTLFWRAEREVPEDYTVFVQLLDEAGNVIAQDDGKPREGFAPSMLWPPGAILDDPHRLTLPEPMPPGRYRLVAGLYRFSDLSRLPVTIAGSPSDDASVELQVFKVRPSQDYAPAFRADIRLGTAIRFRGLTLQLPAQAGAIIRAGTGGLPQVRADSRGTLDVTLEWLAEQPVGNDYAVFVHLLDGSGQLVRQQDNPPVAGRYPTSLWDAGEHIPDPYSLSLDGLPAGKYRLVAGMYRPDTGERLVATGPDGADLPDRQITLADLDLGE